MRFVFVCFFIFNCFLVQFYFGVRGVGVTKRLINLRSHPHQLIEPVSLAIVMAMESRFIIPVEQRRLRVFR